MPRFVRNIGHASHFHTVSCLLLVFVLECVLVEIDRLWAIILRRGLLLVCKLIVNTLEATTANVLSGQQFVNGASIVSRSQLKLVQVERLWQARASRVELAVSIHISVAGGASIVLGWLAYFVPLLHSGHLSSI